MGSSIFADESGDESVRERRTADGRRSIFRRRDRDDDANTDENDRAESSRDGEQSESGQQQAGSGDDGDERTMRVFTGGEVFEFAVDDE